jgi:hypothetical protein
LYWRFTVSPGEAIAIIVPKNSMSVRTLRQTASCGGMRASIVCRPAALKWALSEGNYQCETIRQIAQEFMQAIDN